MIENGVLNSGKGTRWEHRLVPQGTVSLLTPSTSPFHLPLLILYTHTHTCTRTGVKSNYSTRKLAVESTQATPSYTKQSLGDIKGMGWRSLQRTYAVFKVDRAWSHSLYLKVSGYLVTQCRPFYGHFLAVSRVIFCFWHNGVLQRPMHAHLSLLDSAGEWWPVPSVA